MRFCIFFLLSVQFLFSQQKVQVDTILMGTTFRFVVYHDDVEVAQRGIQKGIEEVVRIEKMLSEWNPDTPVSVINQSAGRESLRVSEELFMLFQKSKEYSQKSYGLFDITYAGMEQIWKYDGSMEDLPTQMMIERALEGVGYQYLILNEKEKTIYLSHVKTRVSFGSIGKAYAAQRAAQVMNNMGGVQNLMVDASGDIFVYGTPSKKKCWKIGIYQPFKKKEYKEICLSDEAIVTSGNYEKYALIKGKRYGHIINPKTGKPSTEYVSVTVKGKDAMVANFLSTTLMLASPSERKRILRQYPAYRVWLQRESKKR